MVDILHHVYFFSRKFVKNPKKMCFCYSGFLSNTLIIIVITRAVTLIVIVVVLVVVGLYQM